MDGNHHHHHHCLHHQYYHLLYNLWQTHGFLKEVRAQWEHVKIKCLPFQYTPFEYTSLSSQMLATLPFKT